MSQDMSLIVSAVLVTRRGATRHTAGCRLIPVPEKPWYSVSMDLIIKLPVTTRGHDSICVFVDRLTKMVHFVPCKEKLSAKGFAELYVDNVSVTMVLAKSSSLIVIVGSRVSFGKE
jgi:hypothetical protein